MIGKTLKIAAVAILGMSSMAMADGFVRMSDATGGFNGLNGSGGAFQANTAAPGGPIGVFGGPNASTTSFYTFCIERNENVTLGNATSGTSNLYYGKFASGAINGGNSGGNPDFLSEATALLYSSFRKGQPIAGYNLDGVSSYTLDSKTLSPSALISGLQFAIWYLEGEFIKNGQSTNGQTLNGTGAINSINTGSTTAISNAFYGANIGGTTSQNAAYEKAAALMVNWALANAQAGNFYSVRVLQMWGYDGSGSRSDASNYTHNVQDQLTMVPLPPAAFAGAGLMGLVAIKAYRRRLAAKSI